MPIIGLDGSSRIVIRMTATSSDDADSPAYASAGSRRRPGGTAERSRPWRRDFLLRSSLYSWALVWLSRNHCRRLEPFLRSSCLSPLPFKAESGRAWERPLPWDLPRRLSGRWNQVLQPRRPTCSAAPGPMQAPPPLANALPPHATRKNFLPPPSA